ncbi:hypothetical protein V8D89_007927 [Ganoderma adspersum]
MYRNETSVDPLEEPRLNFDILRLVCHHVTDVPDVLSLSQTCSVLTDDALRRRLKMAPVNLLNAEVLNSFHSFIFSDAPSRAPHVYGLKFPTLCYQVSERADSLVLDRRLVAILEAAVHIQYLDLPTSISTLVFDAVIKLTTVRELWGSELLGDTISASYLHDHLSHLAETLEFLDLDDFPITMLPSSAATQFTAVRSLKLKTAFTSDSDTLDVLLRLFPKLNNTLDLGSRLIGNIAEDEYLAFRERSKDAQKHHAWSKLDRLVCDAAIAYLLALQCPIRRMDIEVFPPHGNMYLADFLRHNSPPKLHVSLSLAAGFSTVLDGLFPIETAEKLTHLVVFADLRTRYRCGARRKANNVHWDRFAGRLIGSIKHLRRLTHLRIVFHSAVYLSAWDPLPDEDLKKIAHRIDLLPAAARFVDAMPPTLEYLFLTTCGHTYIIPHTYRCPAFRQQTLDRWFSSQAWQIVHDKEFEDHHLLDSGLGSCAELTGEAEERILDREELHLSHHEEVRECSDPRGN